MVADEFQDETGSDCLSKLTYLLGNTITFSKTVYQTTRNEAQRSVYESLLSVPTVVSRKEPNRYIILTFKSSL